MLYEGEVVNHVKCCWRAKQAKGTHEIPVFHLLGAMVPVDETAALSRTRLHLFLEKSSLWHHQWFKDCWQGTWKRPQSILFSVLGTTQTN